MPFIHSSSLFFFFIFSVKLLYGSLILHWLISYALHARTIFHPNISPRVVS